MNDNNVLYEEDGKVGCITLNRPEKHNPLDEETIRELRCILKSVSNDDEVHALYISAKGDSFSAGGDLENFSAEINQNLEKLIEKGDLLMDFYKTLVTYEKPIIGAITGNALGAGCGLASSCHVSVASEDARLGLPEITLALFPIMVLPSLRFRLSDAEILELALTGKRLPAREAERKGLVTSVASDRNEATQQAKSIARSIAAKSPFACQFGLRAFYNLQTLDVEEALQTANVYDAIFLKHPDVKEGVRAALDGEEPDWSR